MSAAPTLLFCAGAVKAGTSWFSDYLRHHPECHLRAIKELHYFDFLEGGSFKGRIGALDREIAGHAADLAQPEPQFAMWKRRQLTDKRELRAVLARSDDQIGAYMAYLTDGVGRRRLVADMTPEYGLLPVPAMRRLLDLLPDVRFIFIMRDPVARLWSHVRMLVRRKEVSDADFAAACDVKLSAVCAGEAADVTSRSDYSGIHQRLVAAVPEDRRKVMFYERLISDAGVREVTGFLGLSYQPPDLQRRVHEGVALPISADQRRRAANWLGAQYEFVAATYGLPQEWSPVAAAAARGLA